MEANVIRQNSTEANPFLSNDYEELKQTATMVFAPFLVRNTDTETNFLDTAPKNDM